MVVISTSANPVKEKNLTSLKGLGESILDFWERGVMCFELLMNSYG